MDFINFANTNAISDLTGSAICAIFGFITLTLSLIIGISQMFTVVKTRNTSGTSVLTYFIFVLMGLLSASWGFTYYFQNAMSNPTWSNYPELHQLMIIPILTYYVGDIIFANTLLFIKIRHMILAKRLHKTELELSTYLLNNINRQYIASGRKKYKSKYFPLFVFLTTVLSVLVIFAVLFTIYTKPMVEHHAVKSPIDDALLIAISFTAAGAWEAISWPQFIQCTKKRDTSGISMNWAIFLPITCSISFLYALLLCTTMIPGSFDWSSSGGLFFNGMVVNYGILIIKCKNRKAAEKKHMTELEYTKKILAPKFEAKQIKKLEKTKTRLVKRQLRKKRG